MTYTPDPIPAEIIRRARRVYIYYRQYQGYGRYSARIQVVRYLELIEEHLPEKSS